MDVSRHVSAILTFFTALLIFQQQSVVTTMQHAHFHSPDFLGTFALFVNTLHLAVFDLTKPIACPSLAAVFPCLLQPTTNSLVLVPCPWQLVRVLRVSLARDSADRVVRPCVDGKHAPVTSFTAQCRLVLLYQCLRDKEFSNRRGQWFAFRDSRVCVFACWPTDGCGSTTGSTC